MDQDKELLKALIERRQEMLAKMSEQLKKEYQGLDQQVSSLISAFESKTLLSDLLDSKKN